MILDSMGLFYPVLVRLQVDFQQILSDFRIAMRLHDPVGVLVEPANLIDGAEHVIPSGFIRNPHRNEAAEMGQLPLHLTIDRREIFDVVIH